MAKKIKRNVLSALAEGVVRSADVKERVRRCALAETEEALAIVGGKAEGLSAAEAQLRREKFGTNSLEVGKKKNVLLKIAGAFLNPFTAILAVLAVISALTDIVFAKSGEKNYVTVSVIVVMVAVSGLLRNIQEVKSSNAAAKLASMIVTSACVCRAESGKAEIPVDEIVVGDVVTLSAGDMVPADLRILSAKDLFISQSALTGESAPEEKTPAKAVSFSAAASCKCLAFLGTNVISGSGTGVVIATGGDTVLGQTAKSLAGKAPKTAFEKGVNSVSKILIFFMLAMVPIVFLANGFTKGDWPGAALFAVSVAVGLTPEMLPMIVTTCLAKGSVSLAEKKVIVKSMNSVQNLGAMDILCTDKTGTLTQDKVVLELHLNIAGEEDLRVLRHAFLNSNYQTGLKNLMDVAVIERTNEFVEKGELLSDVLSSYRKVDEIPFDFERRRMSVVVEDTAGKRQLIAKGAVEEMLAACSYAELHGQVSAITAEIKYFVLKKADELAKKGMRVLAVAQKSNPQPVGAFSVADESEMVLIGFLAFLDPPKTTTAAALRRLRDAGVAVKILTGDNEKVSACICKKVGLETEILLGSDFENLSDDQLALRAEEATVLAKLSPAQKERVVRVLREKGHIVGFMGDGINDAPAMRAADVGISVDTAVDIAKESAGVILLEKDLTVVADGVLEGRKTYANMMKYIKITASSNFGNMFSVLAASAFLPFLPMRSVQLIVLNLVYDLSCAAVPWDAVDAEYLSRPAVWDARSVTGFMVRFGPISSLFDCITYAILFFVICPVLCGAQFSALSGDMQLQFIALFQTGWFLESVFTQTFVVHMLRSEKFPFIGTRASMPLLFSSACGIAVLTALPYTPIGTLLGLTALPAVYFLVLAGVLLGYIVSVSFAKKLYLKTHARLL